MLKRDFGFAESKNNAPAAFRRLCVETYKLSCRKRPPNPAAFRRLCVETTGERYTLREPLPAAFRRLCVETGGATVDAPSCLSQPPLGGCVLKLTVGTPKYVETGQPPLGGCVLKLGLRVGVKAGGPSRL